MTFVARLLATFYSFFSFLFPVQTYDAIIVGAGAGGCPLAQTLVEGGLRVLLVERGDERGPNTETLQLSVKATGDVCVDDFVTQEGVVVAGGNCMGGATSINHGIWIEETVDWVLDQMGSGFGTAEQIQSAFEWVRGKVASPGTRPEGSAANTYLDMLADSYNRSADFAGATWNIGNDGQPTIPDDTTLFRTYSIFDSETGKRYAADTVLDRDHENLKVMVKTNVLGVLFDGDWGVPHSVSQPVGPVPRARCVLLGNFGGRACVQPQGRIYLTAGVFRTPELLMKSGIGKGGSKVDNPEVRLLGALDR